MPTQKKKVKKATETGATKPAVDIKQEPEELKPLGAYVDDRLELIRQVFSCVKPKEIKYLLPDFLEGKSNDVIKERCLDELLGISTKRLHSIINNAKCPTDTESSSEEEGSDVEKIEEHISLDEISSDSDVDSKRTSKRSKKADAAKPTDERNGEPKSEKEMTVLELLELQARARAIRSQLALEPVTKIEIDSEHEADDGGRHGDVDTDDESKQSGSKSSEQAKNGNHFKKENSNSNAQQLTKRVRLKRNFRIRKVGDEDDDEHEVSSNPPDNGREKSIEQSMEAVEPEEKVTEKSEPEETAAESDQLPDDKIPTADVEPAEKPAEQDTGTTVVSDANVVATVVAEDAPPPEVANETIEKDTPVSDATELRKPDEGNETRESSPEVIPVEASPETLCISSDSEEERLAKERASIFVPNIEELDRQAKKAPTPEPEQPAEDTEPEEGEISEEEPPEPPVEEPMVAEQQPDPTDKTTADTEQPEVEKDDGTDQAKPQDTATEAEAPAVEKAAQETVIQTLSSSSEGSDGSSSSSSSSDSSSEAEEDDEAKAEATKLDHSAQDDEDIVEIHDSGDENLLLEDKPPEEEVPKSWNSRWLKSNRVAKVMAASRLGNKVREKLKKKKQIQQAAEQQQAQQAQQEPPAVMDNSEASQPSPKPGDSVAELPANVELGSVEHYRELVAKQQEGKQN